MLNIINIINAALAKLFDIICLPFLVLTLNPIWAMIGISLLAGLLLVWLFGKVSNQDAIKRVKNKIRGNLIGVRLFQNDLKVTLRLQGQILRDTLTYMKYSVIPMCVLMIPFILIMIQLNLRFSVRPLQPGEQVLVSAKFADPQNLSQRATLKVPKGLIAETSGVHIKSKGEVAWRIRAEKPDNYKVKVRVGNDTVEKEVLVGKKWGSVSALRTNQLLDFILYWGENPITSNSLIQSVQVMYPALEMPIFGFNMHWVIYFFILSIAFGFVFKDLVGVQV